MAERRMMRKDLCENDAFNSLTMPAQILYIMLILYADDEGCFRADPKYWSRTVFYGKRQGPTRVGWMLDELQKEKLIVIGETKYGSAGFIPDWFSMQTLSAAKSKPSKFFELLVANGITPRWGLPAQDTQREGKRTQEKIDEISPNPSEKSFREVAGKVRDETIAASRALVDKMSMN